MHPSANVPPWPLAEALVVAGRAFAGAMVALLAAPLCVQSQTPADSVACDGFAVVSSELSHKEAEQYCKYAARERQKVEKYWARPGATRSASRSPANTPLRTRWS
jgi:hypothetical protein